MRKAPYICTRARMPQNIKMRNERTRTRAIVIQMRGDDIPYPPRMSLRHMTMISNIASAMGQMFWTLHSIH